MGFFGMDKQGKTARNAMSTIATTDQANAANDTQTGKDLQSGSGQNLATYLARQKNLTYGTAGDVKSQGSALTPQAGKAESQLRDLYGNEVGNVQNTTATPNSSMAADLYGQNKGLAPGEVAGTQGTANTGIGWTNNMYQAAENRIAPGSELVKEKTAESFAPQIAATAQSLRSAGIDPNSPQGIEAMNNVKMGESQALDSASLAGINQLNADEAARVGYATNAQTAATAAENQEKTTGQQLTNAAGQNVQNTNIQNNAMLQQDVANKNANIVNANVNIPQQVNSGGASLLDKQLQAKQSQAGANLNAANLQQSGALGYTNAATAANGQAGQLNQSIYNTSSANSGWGLKGLMGLAGTALTGMPMSFGSGSQPSTYDSLGTPSNAQYNPDGTLNMAYGG